MKKPKLFDVVKILEHLPEHRLLAGTRGVIVEQYSNDEFEVEFANEAGETIALCTLNRQKFTVARRSSTQLWLVTANGVHFTATRPSVRDKARRKPKTRRKEDILRLRSRRRKQELARRLSEQTYSSSDE